jgi:hypothetical protein
MNLERMIVNKRCSYCGAEYAFSQTTCPACGAAEHSVQSPIKEAVKPVISGVSCKVGLHNWKHAENKCERRCESCGALEKLDHQWEGSVFAGKTCVRCGARRKAVSKWFVLACAVALLAFLTAVTYMVTR